MKILQVVLLLLFGVVGSTDVLSAETIAKKRLGPAKVEPVTIDGVRYEAIQWGKARDLDQNGGYIGAYDQNTGKELWLLKIYDVSYEGDIEDDKQDIFITRLRQKCGRYLVIENEKGQRFIVDLKTRSVESED